MSSKKPNSFIFAFVMCVICSFLLTAAAVGLKPYQEKNKLVDQHKNILKSLGLVDLEASPAASQIEDEFKANVNPLWMTPAGMLESEKTSDNDLIVYVYGSADAIQSYSMPFKAYGLWSWIKGYVALDGDGKTIRGITVYEHAETPGLGGECEKPWFQKQFVGKSIVDSDGVFASIGIVKGKVSEKIDPDHQNQYVDGISGATLTSQGLEHYLKAELAQYEPLSKRLRQGEAQ